MQRSRSRFTSALAAFVLAACAGDPITAPARVGPPAPRLAAGFDYGSGQWTVTDVIPLPPTASSAVGALLAINNNGEATGRYNGRAIRVGASGTDVTYLEGGTVGNGINDAGDVVGLAANRAVLWRAGGGRVDLSALAGAADGQARPNAINNRGQVAGEANGRAVLWEPGGSVTPIGVLPGATTSRATAVNAGGTVVGTSGTRAFVWTPASGIQPLATPSGSSQAYDINDAGAIAGAIDGQPVVWTTPGAYTVLTVGGSFVDRAVAISNDGAVVGMRVTRPFLYPTTSSAPQDFVTLGCNAVGNAGACRGLSSASASAINDRGQIAGFIFQDFFDPNRQPTHVEAENPVIWTFVPSGSAPVAEPLVSRASGKCLDVLGASHEAGAPLVIYPCTGGENQWFTVPAVGATSELRVYGGTLCLDAYSGQGNNGDRIVIWPCTGGANQRWTRTAAGELRGINGRCLDVQGGRTEDYTPVWLWDRLGASNQQWASNPGEATSGALASRASGKCLDILGGSREPGTAAVIYPCLGLVNQQLTFPVVGLAGEIRVYGTMCLDAYGGQGNNGDRIVIWPCTGGANQRWTRTVAGELRGINGRCVDVQGQRTSDLTPVWLWDCLGTVNQRWDPAARPVATRS